MYNSLSLKERSDFGCLLLNNQKITNNSLYDIAKSIGSTIYFAKSMTTAKNLQNSLNQSPETRFASALIEKRVRNELVIQTEIENPSEVLNKNIFISYWGSV